MVRLGGCVGGGSRFTGLEYGEELSLAHGVPDGHVEALEHKLIKAKVPCKVEHDDDHHVVLEVPREWEDVAIAAIDGFIAPRPPTLVEKGHPNIGWLFADPVAAAKDYFKRTGIFPIMHVLVMRRAVFGAGLLQVATCSLVIGMACYYLFGFTANAQQSLIGNLPAMIPPAGRDAVIEAAFYGTRGGAALRTGAITFSSGASVATVASMRSRSASS